MENINNGRTILLVEDEALIAMNEAAMLKKYGYDVVTVHSAERAFSAVSAGNIDLILMDIDLGKGKTDGTASGIHGRYYGPQAGGD